MTTTFRRLSAAALAVLLFSGAFSAAAQECPPASEDSALALARAASGWYSYDKQTVLRADGSVDHRASHANNWAGVKEEWHALTHLDKIANLTELASTLPVLGAIIAVAAYPYAMIAEGLDWVVAPTLMVKHGADSLTHGFLGLFQRRRSSTPR